MFFNLNVTCISIMSFLDVLSVFEKFCFMVCRCASSSLNSTVDNFELDVLDSTIVVEVGTFLITLGCKLFIPPTIGKRSFLSIRLSVRTSRT